MLGYRLGYKFRYRLGYFLGNSLGRGPKVRVWFMVQSRACLWYKFGYV